MSKVFNFSGGALVVRQNGWGVDKQCLITGKWSVLFLSSFSTEETDILLKLVRN